MIDNGQSNLDYKKKIIVAEFVVSSIDFLSICNDCTATKMLSFGLKFSQSKFLIIGIVLAISLIANFENAQGMGVLSVDQQQLNNPNQIRWSDEEKLSERGENLSSMSKIFSTLFDNNQNQQQHSHNLMDLFRIKKKLSHLKKPALLVLPVPVQVPMAMPMPMPLSMPMPMPIHGPSKYSFGHY